MKKAFAAFIFLTFGRRCKALDLNPQHFGPAIAYLPIGGVILGSLLVLLNRLLDPYLESEIIGVTLVATQALMTGGIHFVGLQRTFDAFPAKQNFYIGEKAQARAFGVLAILITVLLKVSSLEVTGETRSRGLLLAPVFARWALVIFLYGSASIAEGTARIIAVSVRAWHLVLMTVVTLALAGFLVARTALWMGLCLSLFALLSRDYLRRRNGRIDTDNFGAVVELAETLSFLLFASL
jgi:adenosylcobinamide-GDP ribazoletransferase